MGFKASLARHKGQIRKCQKNIVNDIIGGDFAVLSQERNHFLYVIEHFGT